MSRLSFLGGVMDEIAKNIADGLAPQVYEDLAQPALKEIGSVVGRSVRALLAPVRSMLWGYELIEHVVVEGVERRLKNRPKENRRQPEPEIFVPAAQALTYTAQNETLREMFLNLIANAMDKSQNSVTHPCLVDVVKQMDRLDALLIKQLSLEDEVYIPVVLPRANKVGKNKFLHKLFPTWYLGFIHIEKYDAFDISTSLVRLNRLGLIELHESKSLMDKDKYLRFKDDPYLLDLFEVGRKANPHDTIEKEIKEGVIQVSDFGRQFIAACLR
jgi:hypothetical protein